jgi:hypothetical protein
MGMGVIVIRCPRTGNEVSTGVEIDADRFKTLPPTVSRMRCPACGSEHAWSKRSASFKALGVAEPGDTKRARTEVRAPRIGHAMPEKRDPAPVAPAPAAPVRRGSVRDIVSRLLGSEERRPDAAAKVAKPEKPVPRNEGRGLT